MVFALGEFEPGFTRADNFQFRGQARLRFVVELQFARRKERDELRVDLGDARDGLVGDDDGQAHEVVLVDRHHEGLARLGVVEGRVQVVRTDVADPSARIVVGDDDVGALGRPDRLLDEAGPVVDAAGVHTLATPVDQIGGAGLSEDAEILRQVRQWLQAHGVLGLFPANSVNDGEDIEIYGNEKRDAPVMTWHNLRQQNKKPTGNPNLCLGDFVAPKESGVKDYAGAFAVTAGAGIEKKLAEFEKNHDDYSAIVLKALADRLAEAFAELLHKRVRREFWGYAKDETLDNDALISEKYRGIRPAPGYPACPDHTEKAALFELLDCKRAGITLTESMAMLPAASVSGFYLAHPQAQYFAVGKMAKDQVESYAARKGMSIDGTERWLAPNLGY